MSRFMILVLLFSVTANADTTQRFRAVINADGAVAPDRSVSQETRFSGVAEFLLTIPAGGGSPTLAYEAVFAGLDFGGQDADGTNNATAIHFHDTTGVDYSAATPHVLNVFGFPSQDDAQMTFDAAASTVSGVWDDGDLTDPGLGHAGNPMANSDTLTSALDALLAGELFLMMHTTSPDGLVSAGGATIGGRIVAIPEPSTAWLLAGTLSLVRGRSSRRA